MRAVSISLSLSLALPRALADTNTCSATPGGPLAGPCRAGNEFCGPAFGADTPRVHIQDVSCGENDPNFPLYDPLHKLYHHFWQAHLATPPGHGPDIGHAVSADLVHWAHLPVAVWNDRAYVRKRAPHCARPLRLQLNPTQTQTPNPTARPRP